jgi:hypothetical protein
MTTERHDPRALADRVVDDGSRAEDLVDALAGLGEDRAAFMRRLASRAVLRDQDGEPAAEEPGNIDALIAHAQAVYEAEKERTAEANRFKDLSRLPTWIDAKAAFGDDVTFVIKLAGRSVSSPTPRFLRYAADALGVAIAQVREHFSEGLPRGLVGAENKAPGKPRMDAVEDFETAVLTSNVPETLRVRWLAE